MVPVNYLSVLVAAVISMVLGVVWYGPLFGKQWIAIMGFSKKDIASARKSGMGGKYALQMIGSLVMAYVLHHALVFASTYLQVTGIPAGVEVGFWNWIGFVAPLTLTFVLWEGKPWKWWFIVNGYYLVTFVVMGIVLAVW